MLAALCNTATCDAPCRVVRALRAHTRTCTHTHMHAHIHTHTHAHTHTHVHAHTGYEAQREGASHARTRTHTLRGSARRGITRCSVASCCNYRTWFIIHRDTMEVNFPRWKSSGQIPTSGQHRRPSLLGHATRICIYTYIYILNIHT